MRAVGEEEPQPSFHEAKFPFRCSSSRKKFNIFGQNELSSFPNLFEKRKPPITLSKTKEAVDEDSLSVKIDVF